MNLEIYRQNPITGNTNKTKREDWCVQRLINFHSFENYEIERPAQNDSIDIILRHDSKIYNIQIVEISPRDRSVFQTSVDNTVEFEDGANLIKNNTKKYNKLILNTVEIKESKKYSNTSEVNLLIYLNIPNIIVDPDLDIDVLALERDLKDSCFASVILLTDKFVGGEEDRSVIYLKDCLYNS